MKPFIVGVAGGSASGKTAVCREITKQLGEGNAELVAQKVVIVSLSSFYKTLTSEEQALAAEGNYNFDHPDAFDWEKLLATLNDIIHGRKVVIRQYNYQQNEPSTPRTISNRPEVVLLEGILVLYDKKVRDLLSMMVFVDEDSDTRLARRTLRDMQELGRDVNSVLNNYIKYVKPSFDDYIFPTKRSADIIIPRGLENQVAIDLIVQHIRNILLERATGHQPSSSVPSSPELKMHASANAIKFREIEN